MNATPNNLYGLILAGGRSKRMGQDKSKLTYSGKTQVEHACDLLTPWCGKVFISTRKDQAQDPVLKTLPQLHDLSEFNGIGPLGGILSAMTTYPKASWLVFACDLPFVTKETLQYLITNRHPQKFATAFISAHDQLPEPLCAIWEAGKTEEIHTLYREGINCPRKILIKSKTNLIVSPNAQWLNNINTPEEYTSSLPLVGRAREGG